MIRNAASSLIRLPVATAPRPRLSALRLTTPQVFTRYASTLPTLVNNERLKRTHKVPCNKRCCSSHAAASTASAEAPVEELLVYEEVAATKEYVGQELLRLNPMKYIEFICAVCQGKVCKTFSRHSYEKGVVLIKCDGCKNLHLIADNIDFTGFNERNIEEIARNRGQTVTTEWDGVIEIKASTKG